ncbi:MAG: PEGA domain-containing protein, partial [Polyangiaceae bacterium]|nr:PEGA domain-containing protein [Polyangiaceae bacterium]
MISNSPALSFARMLLARVLHTGPSTNTLPLHPKHLVASCIALFIILGPSLSSSSIALAQDSADEADLRFRVGAERYRAGDYQGALVHFMASARLVPNRNVTFNIARAYEMLGQYPQAFRYYQQVLDEETDVAERRRILQAVDRIRQNVAVLSVVTNPPGATVYLERKDLGGRGVTPRVLAYDPGTYRVIVELDGYRDGVVEDVELVLGSTSTINVSLSRITGSVVVAGLPRNAEIRIDDVSGAPACVGG